MTSSRSILLAAGGTGGHLFPAYALAEELVRRGHMVDLATDMRGDRYGTGFPSRTTYKIPSATFANKSPVSVIKTGVTLTRGIVAARKLLKRLRPAVVIGFGGYPSFPPLMAARMIGIPTALHEQNAVLGRANKFLANRVSAIATSFEQTKFLDGALAAKSRFTGNPVRDLVTKEAGIAYAAPTRDGPINLLVFGGSQGARYFSEAIPPALQLLDADLRSRLVVVQQAREEDQDAVRAVYASAGIKSEVSPFFKDLPARMANAHLVVARAGASSVAELAILGRPSILVPLPHALDNDQLQNATRLAEAGGAWCFEQKFLTPERLAAELSQICSDPARLATAAAAAKSAGRPDAVARLADMIEELAG